MKQGANQKIRSGYDNNWQVKEKCLKTLSEYRERRCRCRVWWKTVPEVDVGNWKGAFVDGGLERLNGCTASWLEEVDRMMMMMMDELLSCHKVQGTARMTYCGITALCIASHGKKHKAALFQIWSVWNLARVYCSLSCLLYTSPSPRD